MYIASIMLIHMHKLTLFSHCWFSLLIPTIKIFMWTTLFLFSHFLWTMFIFFHFFNSSPLILTRLSISFLFNSEIVWVRDLSCFVCLSVLKTACVETLSVCLAPCALCVFWVSSAHPVCMVRLQSNGGGQSKMPGSFLLPPPPPVARPVPLPMPDSKIISTPTDGGLSSPASPCKSPPTPTPLHQPPLLPQSPHRGQLKPILGSSRLVSSQLAAHLFSVPIKVHKVC